MADQEACGAAYIEKASPLAGTGIELIETDIRKPLKHQLKENEIIFLFIAKILLIVTTIEILKKRLGVLQNQPAGAAGYKRKSLTLPPGHKNIGSTERTADSFCLFSALGCYGKSLH